MLKSLHVHFCLYIFYACFFRALPMTWPTQIFFMLCPPRQILWLICYVDTWTHTGVNVPTSAENHCSLENPRKAMFWSLWKREKSKKDVFHKGACFCPLCCVCGTEAPGRGPVPCHSGTTSQSFLRSKISSPPPFPPRPPPLAFSPPHMCSSRQHLSPSDWQETTEEGQRSWGRNGWQSANFQMNIWGWWKDRLRVKWLEAANLFQQVPFPV